MKHSLASAEDRFSFFKITEINVLVSDGEEPHGRREGPRPGLGLRRQRGWRERRQSGQHFPQQVTAVQRPRVQGPRGSQCARVQGGRAR